MTTPFALRLYANEARYEMLKNVRQRSYAITTIAFPVMFYLFFGVANRRSGGNEMEIAKYLFATYSAMGVISAALYGFGITVAIERGQGWLEVKEASPMPPAAYLVAKVVSSMAFGLMVLILLFVIGFTTAGVRCTPAQALQLLAVVLAGSIPFSALGLVIGLLAKPSAAPGIVNLIYIPACFCSGLWVPFEFLPHLVQRIAPLLPWYHQGQLALGVFHYDRGGSAAVHWLVLAGFAGVCFLACGVIWRRRDAVA